jgi:hypothetical protein
MRIKKKKLIDIVESGILGESHHGASDQMDNPREELATQIRHASKDIHGYKDHYDLRGKSVEELEDILYDLANSPEQRYLDDEARIEMEDEMGYDSDLSRAEMAPRRQGMSRRPGGSKSQRRMESKVRITKRQLQRIIKEEKAKLLRENPQDNLRLLATVIDNLTELAVGYGVDEDMKGELRMQVELLNDVYSSMYNKSTGYQK